MKMRFLCVRHRRWLSSDPAAALYTFFQCYEQGLRLEQSQQVDLAIRQAGAAFETADLILASGFNVGPDDITRHTHSALLLARLLRRRGAADQSHEVARRAIDGLERLVVAGIEPEAVRDACQQLADLAGPLRVVAGSQWHECARQLH